MDDGRRGGGHARLARHVDAPVRCEDVLGALPATSPSCARADSRTGRRSCRIDPDPDGRRGGGAALGAARSRSPPRSTGLGCRSAGRTHPPRRWEDVESRPARATSSSTRRCASSRSGRPSACTSTSPSNPETATRACNAPRGHVPILLALSGNSPFWQGRDSGLRPRARRSSRPSRAPARRALLRATPDYVEAIDVLVRSDRVPEPTFLWWDARLQPRIGTVEVRIMDSQIQRGRHRGDRGAGAVPRAARGGGASPSRWPTRC